MSWVLLVYLSWPNLAMAMMRFPDEGSCETAAQWYKDTAASHVRTICLRDGDLDVKPPDDGQPKNEPLPMPDK